MHRLVQEGVPPAEAARAAIHTQIGAEDRRPGEPVRGAAGSGRPAGAEVPADTDGRGPARGADSAHSAACLAPAAGGCCPCPRSPRSARGLARAAMSLDSQSCQRTVSASLADRGAIRTWEELIRPVLGAVGERWAQTSRGVEIEHSFSTVVAGALAAHSAGLERPRNGRPVVLASAPDELHDLPLMVLQAALSDVAIRSHVIGAADPG